MPFGVSAVAEHLPMTAISHGLSLDDDHDRAQDDDVKLARPGGALIERPDRAAVLEHRLVADGLEVVLDRQPHVGIGDAQPVARQCPKRPLVSHRICR
jgi:hypothetical protein